MPPAFQDFLAKFPPVAMPVTLGEDTHHTFSAENEPLSATMIEQIILPIENGNETDEFTEYVPCFSLEGTEQFYAVVWWKAELLNYEYVLATFSLQGQLIGRQTIAGMHVTDGKVYSAVANINEDWEIAIAEGVSADGNQLFDPTTSRIRHLEIMVNGAIVTG
ncbi:MAG: hypothetical protein SFV22_07550 [Saprospiraceae bacterium]|nr:hypothetical protein [Saprospiraceae bacterium]